MRDMILEKIEILKSLLNSNPQTKQEIKEQLKIVIEIKQLKELLK